MRGRSFILYFLLICPFLSPGAYAQKDSDAWILKEILKDSSFTGEILCKSFREQGPLFWPSDLKLPDDYTGHDNFVKNKNGLFIAIEGTGRVYRISMEADELNFTRIDSTFYTGYNFGAFVFSFNDTIYSLGGYGFWEFNGQLRYFRPSKLGWEVKPVNRKIPVGFNNTGIYLDQKYSSIYYVSDSRHFSESLKKNSDQEHISNQVFDLNLKTKDWKESGIPTTDLIKLTEVSGRIAVLPWGELFLAGPRAQYQYETTLVDYRTNRIFALKKSHKSDNIFNLRYGAHSELNKRLITYYHDSVLTILTSNKERLDIPLNKSDFTDTGISVYVPVQENSILTSTRLAWLGMIAAVSLSILGFVLWKRRKPEPAPIPFERNNAVVFDPVEQELLKRFLANPEPCLSVDEVDQILDTTKKSKDVQNQKRSSATRSINNKFLILTGDPGNLIFTSRLEFDRRMIQYKLDIERYRKIEHLLK